MEKQNKKKLAPVLAAAVFVVLAVVLALVWQFTRPAPVEGAKHITVEVIHKDETTKTFTYDTDAEYLAEVLVDAGLISGDESEFGLYVKVVDGETADYDVDQSWWGLSINGEFAQTGVSATPVYDGDTYTWTYTIG
ncbi:MAG: DUF4430 domain-containing protein [Oscillospiraceae bacterium]|nr:DUF4430 domain-containing protein [Oscillospiraceae bacterium]